MMFFSSLFLSGLTLVLYDFSVIAAPNPTTVPKIRFYCIHSSDTTYKEIRLTDKDISENLDLELDFAFFVHGWRTKFSFDEKESIPYKIGLEWVNAKRTNFCGVDWRDLAYDGYYDASQKYVKYVGAQLATFLMLLKEHNVKMDSISIAGHSLGAHVAGFAGKKIYDSYNTKISTIFGLDPAGPFFTSYLVVRSDFVLSKNDANFVQILHTASGTLGTTELIGHADYIASGGQIQIFCISQLFYVFKCSHILAIEIFLSSFANLCSANVTTEGFITTVKDISSKSNDESSVTDVYGIHNNGTHGLFDLKTSYSQPFCKTRKLLTKASQTLSSIYGIHDPILRENAAEEKDVFSLRAENILNLFRIKQSLKYNIAKYKMVDEVWYGKI